MSKKTNSINLRSIRNKNLKSNVIFEKYNYSKLLYQDFYIRDFLENALKYNFHDSISHKLVIQRKQDTIYIFLDYYLFKDTFKSSKGNSKIFNIRRRFRWKKKNGIYKKYFDIGTHLRQKRVNKNQKFFNKEQNFSLKEKLKRFNSPIVSVSNSVNIPIYSFKRLLILNLMLLTGCKVKLYTRNVKKLLSLPSFVREKSLNRIKRNNIKNIMKDFRIRGYVNNIKGLKVPEFIHLVYTSFTFQNPQLLGTFLGTLIKKNIKTFRFFYFFCSKALLPLFIFSNLNGIKIQFKGRLGSSLRKRTSIIQFGQMPLQSIASNIKYSFNESITIYGVCGIKIWYYYLTE